MSALRLKLASWFIDRVVPLVFPHLNPVTRWVLKSRLHFLISWYVILLRFEGRRTGKLYEVPVAYHRPGQGVIEAFTSRGGVWWQNFRSTSDIAIVFRGAARRARIEVVLDDREAIEKALRSRDLCRRLLVPVSIDKTVLLRLHLLPSAPAKTGA
ncbi:MAG: hypothetical protein HY532_08670 [Chloroflexi bacterium]|nr:hypothetical protein [Chloroflexota bacterium]